MTPLDRTRLVEAVALEPVETVGPVHFVAAGGAGMSGIATLYAQLGVEVSGSDREDSPALRALAAAGARVHVGHRAEQLGPAATVVVSSAITPDNPELAEARRRGLRIWHRSTALGALMLRHRGVAVAGTAGKTTTSAMVATVLVEAGLQPSYVIGALLRQTGASSALGAGDVMVVEADESDGSFLQYPAEIVVVTNIEADHLDNWGTPEAYRQGFLAFATAPGVRAVVLCVEDPGCRWLAGELAELGEDAPEVVLYGRSALADLALAEVAVTADRSTAELRWRGGEPARLSVPAPGEHSVLNAAAGYAVGRLLGVSAEVALASLAGFGGTERRFQRIGVADGVTVVDDYAHHPTKVRAALTAGRVAAADGRLVVCFQPHLFSRTRDFAEEFGRALALADEVVLTEIYPAREQPLPGVSSALVESAVAAVLGAEHVRVVGEGVPAAAVVAGLAEPGDLVMTVGAGDVTRVAPQVLALLQRREGGR